MTVRKQRDGSWLGDFSYTDEEGLHRKRKRFRYRKDALDWLLNHQQEHAQGKNKDATAFIYLFDRYYDIYKKNFIRLNTQKSWETARKWVVKEFGTRKLIDQITQDNYQQFIIKEAKNHSRNTVRGISQKLSEVFNYAVSEGYINRSPSENARITGKKPRDVDYLNLSEIKTLLNYIFTAHIPRRWHSTKDTGTAWLVAAAIVTGCRLGELSGLTWDRVDTENGIFHITRQLGRDGKFAELKTESAERDIPVPKSFIEKLQNIKDKGDTFVFYAQTNKPVQVSTANYELKSLLKQCKISAPGFHFHSLRHSHVALLLSKGVDIYAISKRLGHSRFDITLNTYAYLLTEKQQKDNEKIVSILSEFTE